MIDVDLSPIAPISPKSPVNSPGISLGLASFNPLWIVVIFMGGVLSYDHLLSPTAATPAPAVSPLATNLKSYLKGKPADFKAVAAMVRNGSIDTASKLDAEFSRRSLPMAVVVKAAVLPRCDQATGKITDPAGLADDFDLAATFAGGK